MELEEQAEILRQKSTGCVHSILVHDLEYIVLGIYCFPPMLWFHYIAN